MGSHKEERDVTWYKIQKRVKACIACLAAFLISMVGGLILACWELKYHPTNSQLWMVPFGLILFLTPLIVWFSVLVSDICNSKEDAYIWNQLVISQDNAVHDPER